MSPRAEMKQLQIEVEPLSERRWERIERSLMERLEQQVPAAPRVLAAPAPPSRVRLLMAAAAVMGLLALVSVAYLRVPEPVAQHPSRIITGENPSHLALPGLALDVNPQSAVVVGTETPQGMLVVLDRGSIVCDVEPRSKEAPLIVQAGEARVRVIGTRFSVTRVGESSRVAVEEGVVEVTSRGHSVRVRAGEQWPATEPAELGPEPSEKSAAEPTAPSETAEVETDKPEPAIRTPRQSKTPKTVAEPEPEPATLEEPSSQELFEQATALERSDPSRASSIYRRLESRGDSWSSNALYARGRLAASRGSQQEARRLLETYLKRFPKGSNAQDARVLLRRLR